MADNHMPAPSGAPTPQHPFSVYDSPPSYANSQAHLPPLQNQSHNERNHNTIILPPIPAVESLSLHDRDERPSQTHAHTHSGTGSMPPLSHSNSGSNLYNPTHSHTSSRSAQSLPLPQPVEPPEPIQPRYQPPTSWPSSNPFVSYYRGPDAQQTTTQTSLSASHNASPRGMDSPQSTDVDREGRGNSVNIDDPDVRMAAEALGDLRADFIQTPPNGQRHRSASNNKRNSSNSRRSQPEPLLSLLTSHPLIGPAVNQAGTAYSAGKNYSPYFKSTAECVERRVMPVVNKVGTVGRVTGVEGGVRWFLGGRRRHNRPRGNTSCGSNNDEQGAKRRKMRDETEGSSSRNSYASTYSYASANPQEAAAQATGDRRDSQASSMVDSLPAYDDFTSPSYVESQVQQNQTQQVAVREDYRDDSVDDSSWQRKLILSTSGLSIAMSDESLRSLKYCLTWLRWAGDHIGRVLAVLTGLLEKHQNGNGEVDEAGMNRKVQELKADVLKTLKDVVEIVSKYAGGALPENAKVLVRRHLTSLPARFKIAQEQSQSEAASAEASPRNSLSTDGASSPREGARRATLLAKEGMEMMNQVSGILDLTIVSAEEWRQKLGKGGDMKDPVIEGPCQEQQQQQMQQPLPPMRQNEYNGDYRMGEAM